MARMFSDVNTLEVIFMIFPCNKYFSFLDIYYFFLFFIFLLLESYNETVVKNRLDSISVLLNKKLYKPDRMACKWNIMRIYIFSAIRMIIPYLTVGQLFQYLVALIVYYMRSINCFTKHQIHVRLLCIIIIEINKPECSQIG